MTEYDAPTRTILKWFERLSAIPRESGNEAEVRSWLVAWGNEHGCSAKTDAVGNVVIRVPGSAGYESSAAVVIQGHMDMVCEKVKGSAHDFARDPIQLHYDGEWLKARETTLGADNGIAIAMALALVDGGFPHGPLELLFTVDEETGLTGAQGLQPGFIEGRILLNLDSEDEGVFTVGCAGGRDTETEVPVDMAQVPDEHVVVRLLAGGMSGGHSGVDIHEQRANALKVLARALGRLIGASDVRIVELAGGTAHNAIPRDAEAVIAVPGDDLDRVRGWIAELDGVLKQEYAKTDPRLSLALEEQDATPGSSMTATTPAGSRRVVDLVLAMPDGVWAYSPEIAGLVETSNNLAKVKLAEGKVWILTSQRSSSMPRLHLLTSIIEGVARLAGGTAHSDEGYPSWAPNMESPLLQRCVETFEALFDGKKPVVEIIHAGLECGLIGDRYPGMDMISFGPTIKNPHCPDEKLHLPSVGLVWRFLVSLLETLR